jgi:hypothetical protein
MHLFYEANFFVFQNISKCKLGKVNRSTISDESIGGNVSVQKGTKA